MAQQNTILKRAGERPTTGAQPPHLQYSDISPRSIHQQMARWGLTDLPAQIPFISHQPTRISVPTSEALWLDESVQARREAFMPPPGSREFAHLHEDGSWHLVVDESLVGTIVDAGWGERHPWYDRGVLEVLVYAPRNEAEMQVVQQLVISAIEHASAIKINAA
ncbi:MAG: luciferase family protein [Candidatus Thiodiazotropha endolucinida]